MRTIRLPTLYFFFFSFKSSCWFVAAIKNEPFGSFYIKEKKKEKEKKKKKKEFQLNIQAQLGWNRIFSWQRSWIYECFCSFGLINNYETKMYFCWGEKKNHTLFSFHVLQLVLHLNDKKERRLLSSYFLYPSLPSELNNPSNKPPFHRARSKHHPSSLFRISFIVVNHLQFKKFF